MPVTKKICGHTGCFEEFFYIDGSDSSFRIYQQAYDMHLDGAHEGNKPLDLSSLFGDSGLTDSLGSRLFAREG